MAHPVLCPLWLSVGDLGSQRHSDFRLSLERCFLMLVPKGSSRTGTRGWPAGLRVLLEFCIVGISLASPSSRPWLASHKDARSERGPSVYQGTKTFPTRAHVWSHSTLSALQPRGLCTCAGLCLECSPPGSPSAHASLYSGLFRPPGAEQPLPPGPLPLYPDLHVPSWHVCGCLFVCSLSPLLERQLHAGLFSLLCPRWLAQCLITNRVSITCLSRMKARQEEGRRERF